MTDAWHMRLADSDDAEAIIEVSDEAAAWLVDHGLSGQWGPEPPSSDASFVARVPSWIRNGEASVAVSEGGEVLGYSVAQLSVEDAIYVHTLASRMTPSCRGVGRSLLARAADGARAVGLTWVRLECWADNPRLRAYYESLGLVECDAFVDEGWRGIVMELRV